MSCPFERRADCPLYALSYYDKGLGCMDQPDSNLAKPCSVDRHQITYNALLMRSVKRTCRQIERNFRARVLVTVLRAAGARIWEHEGGLAVTGPSAIEPEHMNELTYLEPEILAIVRRDAAAAQPPA